VCVVDTNKEEISLNDIPIVREYLEVFPYNIPGLPPDRKIEFAIDILLETGPISKHLTEWHQLS